MIVTDEPTYSFCKKVKSINGDEGDGWARTNRFIDPPLRFLSFLSPEVQPKPHDPFDPYLVEFAKRHEVRSFVSRFYTSSSTGVVIFNESVSG